MSTKPPILPLVSERLRRLYIVTKPMDPKRMDEIELAWGQIIDDVREQEGSEYERRAERSKDKALIQQLVEALDAAAEHTCSLVCSSTWKTGHKPPHSAECLANRAALSSAKEQGYGPASVRPGYEELVKAIMAAASDNIAGDPEERVREVIDGFLAIPTHPSP